MFVLIKCDTCRVGCSIEEVYEFDDNMTEEGLDDYARDLAHDNAESYGIFDEEREECEESGIEFDESDCFSYSYEILRGMSREQVIEQYGEIIQY